MKVTDTTKFTKTRIGLPSKPRSSNKRNRVDLKKLMTKAAERGRVATTKTSQ